MASNDMTDPVVVEADQRAERAKASLRSRFARLERKVGDVRERIDLPAQIRKHPLPAAGIALALGALVGSRVGSRDHAAGGGRSAGGVFAAGLAALGLRLAREFVLAQVGRAARQWWIEHGGDAADLDDPDQHGHGRPFAPP